jgi:hypothetical protein
MIAPGASCLHDCEDKKLNTDRGLRRIRPPRTGLLAIAAGITLLTAACSSSTSTPRVASLGTSSAGTTATATSPASPAPTGSPAQLLDEWATCMQSHGDPGQTDPTIDSNKVIHITYPANSAAGAGGQDKTGPCASYLTAASTALRGGQPVQKPDPAKLLAFSECMRANGIPDFPDPSGGGLQIRVSPGSDLNPDNAKFKNAAKLCAKKTGVGGAFGGGPPPPGSIEATGSQTNGGPSTRSGAGNANG